MDPICTAIVAAITAGASTGATDIAKNAITDSYSALKTLIKKKLGGSSDVVDAIAKLQAKPDSAGRRETLAEEMKATKASEEPDLLAAAESLLEMIKALPNGEQHIQQARGIGIAQASGGSSLSISTGYPTRITMPEEKPSPQIAHGYGIAQAEAAPGATATAIVNIGFTAEQLQAALRAAGPPCGLTLSFLLR